MSDEKQPQDVLFDQISWLRACGKAVLLQRESAPGGPTGWAGRIVFLAASMMCEYADALSDRLGEEVLEENSNPKEHG